MNREEFLLAHEEHQKWLQDHDTGKRFEYHKIFNFSVDIKINLVYADLSYANLSDADLRSANLSYANLGYANLRSANLSYANLRNANLSDANLRNANLSDANLSDANLSYADLRSANLGYANLRSANLDFSCWPLWCGSKKVKVDIKLVFQLLAHVFVLDCDDKIFKVIKKCIGKWAKKSHRAKDLNII